MDDASLLFAVMGIAVGCYSLINMYMLTKNSMLDKKGNGRKFFIGLSATSFLIGFFNIVPMVLS